MRRNRLDHPVIGYRGWFIADGKLLSRWASNHFWEPGENEAKCLRHDQYGAFHVTPAPITSCTCGLHATHAFESALAYQRHAPRAMVFGIVKGWGNIEIAPDGWRAQFAEIKALVRYGNLTHVHQACKHYSVPLLYAPLTELDTVATEFGKFVPEDKRPKPSFYIANPRRFRRNPRPSSISEPPQD